MATVNVLTLALRASPGFPAASPLDGLRLWLAQFKQNNIDIACMQECRVTNAVDLDPVGGYKCYFSGGKTRVRGVGIAVRLSLASNIREVHYISDRMLAVCFQFAQVRLTVLVGYAPAHRGGELREGETHSQEVAKFWKAVKHTLTEVVPREFRDNVVLLGDFNAQLGNAEDIGSMYSSVLGQFLGDARSDYAATALLDFCLEHDFSVANSFYDNSAVGIATWTSRRNWRHMVGQGGVERCPELKNRGAIDHVLVKGNIPHTFCGVDNRFDTTWLTDHRVTRLDTELPRPPPPLHEQQPKEVLKKSPRLDWRSVTKPGITRDRARHLLSKEFSKLSTTSNEVFLYAELRARIFEVCAIVLPEVSAKASKKPSPDWFTLNEGEITKVMAKQWRARQVSLAAPYSKFKRERVVKCQQDTLRLCRRLKGKFWSDVGEKLSVLYEKNDLEGFYRGINTANGAIQRGGVSGRVSGGGKVQLWDRARQHRVPEDRELERWFEHFEELLNQPGTATGYEKYIPPQQEMEEALDLQFTKLELRTAIKNVKNGRATGEDGLPVEVEKYLYSDGMMDLLLMEFNKALASGNADKEWKCVDITVLFKKGSPSVCDNYRGISLINHTGKIMERLLQNRLLPFALKRGLIPAPQFGFLAGVGAADAQGLAHKVVESRSNQNLLTFRAFIDLKKAYDRVDRAALWLVLQRSGVPPLFLALIKDMHTNALATVKHKGVRSQSFLLRRGLKQGSVFAPLLFNIFLGTILNGCDREFREGAGGFAPGQVGVDITWRANARLHVTQPDLMPLQKDFQNTRLYYIAYADDLVMMAGSEAALQYMMNTFVRISEAFGQEVAEAKTKVMVSERVTSRHPTRTKCAIKVHNTTLEVVDSFVYLGSAVTWDGKMDVEIKRRVQRMCGAFSRWREVLQNYDINIKARLMLFQAVIVSNGLYGCEVWNLSQTNLDRLEGVHFHLLRRTIGAAVVAASRTEVMAYIRQIAPKTKIYPLEALAMKRMLRYWGHVARMDPWKNLQAVGARSRTSLDRYRGGKFGPTLESALQLALGEFGFPLHNWQSSAQNRKGWRALLDVRIKTYVDARWSWKERDQQLKRREKAQRDIGSLEELGKKLQELNTGARYFAVMVKYFAEGILSFDDDAEEALDLASFIDTDDSPEEFSFLEEVGSYVNDPHHTSRSALTITRMHALSRGQLSNSFNTTGIDGGVGGEQAVVLMSSHSTAPPVGMVASEGHHNEFLNPEPYVSYYRSDRNVLLPKDQFHPPLNMVRHLGQVQSTLKKVRDVVLLKQALDGKAAPPGVTVPLEPLTASDSGEGNEE